jgi:hypothetical protein
MPLSTIFQLYHGGQPEKTTNLPQVPDKLLHNVSLEWDSNSQR